MQDTHKTLDNVPVRTIMDLNKNELIKLVGLFAGNVLVHYGMWFTESVQKLGLHQTLDLEGKAFSKYGPIAVKRLVPHLKTGCAQDLALSVAQKNNDELIALIRDMAKTWLASDGLWFQAVEACAGMDIAKEINDRCWTNFAALEANKILAFLGLERGCGLVGLRQAMEFRTVSVISARTFGWLQDGSLLLTVRECRVQEARRRKGMKDYPCKSAGVIENSHFAAFIDSAIVTECVYCPPDAVAADEFCCWRFRIE